MDPMLTNVNWLAVIAGAVAAFALGAAWFGPIFGKTWRTEVPAAMPTRAMVVQAVGTFLMAWVIGATETQQAIITAIVVILTIAALKLSGAMFAGRSNTVALIDAGFVVAMGVVMIAAQAIF